MMQIQIIVTIKTKHWFAMQSHCKHTHETSLRKLHDERCDVPKDSVKIAIRL